MFDPSDQGEIEGTIDNLTQSNVQSSLETATHGHRYQILL
jgi:hypothetical protein